MRSFALLILASLAPLAADEAGDTLAAWSRALAAQGAGTLRVAFRQTKTLPVLATPRVSEGLALVRGGRVKLELRRGGQLELALAASETELMLYYPRLARLEIHPRTRVQASAVPLPLVSGDVDALARDHVAALERLDGGAVRIALTARDASAPYQQIVLELREGVLSRWTQVGRRGDRAELEILHWEAGVELAAEDLELRVPAGTERVSIGG